MGSDMGLLDGVAPEGAEVLADVCVIGSGPAGITLTRELAAAGVRVCLLEAGGRDPARRFQRQLRGESDGYPIHRLDTSRVSAFGGTMRHTQFENLGWAARRLDEIDFETREGRPAFGWPFGRDHLEPFYVRAQAACGIQPFETAARQWEEGAAPVSRSVEASPELEGTVFEFPAPRFHEAWDELEASPHVCVLAETRAVDVRADDAGRVHSVLAVRGGRETVVVRPRLVVLAAGGIENARLLLTADGGRGLGNEHDVVGRYFAERLWFHAGHLVLSETTSPEELAAFHQCPGSAIGGGLRVSDEVQRKRGLLNGIFYLVPRSPPVITDAVRSAMTLHQALSRRPVVPHVATHSRRVLTGARGLADLAVGKLVPRPRVLAIRAQGEQSPCRDSRVTLGTTADDLGIPVARVTWRMDSDDHRSIEASAGVLDEVLRAQGLGSVAWTARLDSTTLVEGLHHHMGTTRMHHDPRQGVTDPHGRVHSVDNLFVVGSSVFPTSGASNPTLTILALAIRLADRVKEVLGDLPAD